MSATFSIFTQNVDEFISVSAEETYRDRRDEKRLDV